MSTRTFTRMSARTLVLFADKVRARSRVPQVSEQRARYMGSARVTDEAAWW